MAETEFSDRGITQQVQTRLTRHGLSSPGQVNVATRNGEVTLSGSVRFGHQKSAAAQVAGAVAGVKRVVDQLQIKLVTRT